MAKYIIKLLLLLFIFNNLAAQTPPIVKGPELKNRVYSNNDTVYIVNFWATWCKPCVEELPEFEKLNSSISNKKQKIILVSLDFKENYQKKLLPFIKKKKIKSEIVLLDETDANYFIPLFSEKWQGTIPATLIIKNNKVYRIIERKTTLEELYKIIEKIP